jgi:selenium-binding protein 1
MVKVNADPNGGMGFEPGFFVELENGLRPHQVRLQGGDASSDSFCYS